MFYVWGLSQSHLNRVKSKWIAFVGWVEEPLWCIVSGSDIVLCKTLALMGSMGTGNICYILNLLYG